MPLALDQKVGAVVWSPLGWGRLTGKIRRGQPLPETSRLQSKLVVDIGPPVADEYLYRVVDALDAVAKETGKTVPQIALNWLLQRPTVATVIIGARNEEQLRQNLGAVGWNLTPEQVAKLDAASAMTLAYPYWHQRTFGAKSGGGVASGRSEFFQPNPEKPMQAEPQKEHQWLEKLVGEWTYEGEAIMGPDQPPEKFARHRDRPLARRPLGAVRGQGEMPGGGTGDDDHDARLRPREEAVRRHVHRLDDDAPVGLRRQPGRRRQGADAGRRGPELRRRRKDGEVPGRDRIKGDDHRVLSSTRAARRQVADAS